MQGKVYDTPEILAMINLLKNGDNIARTQLWIQYKERIFVMCLGILKDPDLAEDMVQNVFIRIFTKIHTFRGASSLSTWMQRIAITSSLMELRKQKKLASLNPIIIEEATEKESFDIPYEDLSLAGALDRRQLEKAARMLPRKYRKVYQLRDVEGYDILETSHIMNLSQTAVKSRHLRARRKLQVHLTR